MLPVHLIVALMLAGYLLVMGYLALGLRDRRRQPADTEPVPRALHVRRAARLARAAPRRGWLGLMDQVAGTVVGGYLLLMAVVIGYYYGVARLGGPFLLSAFGGCALLVGLSLPVFFTASWLVERRRRRHPGRTRSRPG